MKGTPWPEHEVMDMKELAIYLKYAYETIICNYKAWNIPHERLCGRVIFFKAAVDAWAANRTRHRINGVWVNRKEAAA